MAENEIGFGSGLDPADADFEEAVSGSAAEWENGSDIAFKG